ncbi:hypothetical protein ACWDZ8_41830 [Streptomyces sp. NPDC003233]
MHADGTAHATLRCAGTRGGTAQVTAAAKAPDIAGAARPVFTLDVDVVPYAQEGCPPGPGVTPPVQREVSGGRTA